MFHSFLLNRIFGSPPLSISADDETAQYLGSCMPSGSNISVGDIKAALESARSHSVNSSFDSRVAEALASLNLR